MKFRFAVPSRRTIFLGLVLAVASYYLYLIAITGLAQPLRIVSTSIEGSAASAGDLVLVRAPDKSPIGAGDIVLLEHPNWTAAPALLSVDGVPAGGESIVVKQSRGPKLRSFPAESVKATLVTRVPVAGAVLQWFIVFGTRGTAFGIAVLLFLRLAQAMEATPRPAFLRLGAR